MIYGYDGSDCAPLTHVINILLKVNDHIFTWECLPINRPTVEYAVLDIQEAAANINDSS